MRPYRRRRDVPCIDRNNLPVQRHWTLAATPRKLGLDLRAGTDLEKQPAQLFARLFRQRLDLARGRQLDQRVANRGPERPRNLGMFGVSCVHVQVGPQLSPNAPGGSCQFSTTMGASKVVAIARSTQIPVAAA